MFQAAQLIVFPEYGITGFDHSRDSMIPFLEDIPDQADLWNPCTDPSRYPQTRVLKTLSCMAKRYEVYVIANMGDIKQCDTESDKHCPKDGRYQFNTNVVFNSNGILVGRYHKRNMYDETPLFDPSPGVEYTIFNTSFGTFGTVVCFDILNYFPTQELLENHGIHNLVVTSAWNAFYPFVLPVQMYSGLAKRNKVNVIASNIRNKPYQMASSGIFSSGVELFSDPDFYNNKGELLVTEISDSLIRKSEAEETELEPFPHNEDGFNKEVYEIADTHSGVYDYGINTTFVILTHTDGQKAVCSRTTCCILHYKFDYKDPHEMYILAAAEYSVTVPGIINSQFCAVHRCESNDVKTCGAAFSTSKSTFVKLKLQGFFDDVIVFPFVATAPEDNKLVSVDMHSYKFDLKQTILESDGFKHPLLSAVLYNSLAYTGESPSTGKATSGSAIVNVSVLGSFVVDVLSVFIAILNVLP